MWLVRIVPDNPRYEKRVFECGACDYLEETVIEREGWANRKIKMGAA
jgi:hypothetical protein